MTCNRGACEEEKDCPEFVLNQYSLKAQKKGGKKTFKGAWKDGDDSVELFCQCAQYCAGEGQQYWYSKVNKPGTKGACACFSGKVKKVKKLKGNKRGSCGGLS